MQNVDKKSIKMKVFLRCFEQHFLEIKTAWFLKNVPQKTRKYRLLIFLFRAGPVYFGFLYKGQRD